MRPGSEDGFEFATNFTSLVCGPCIDVIRVACCCQPRRRGYNISPNSEQNLLNASRHGSVAVAGGAAVGTTSSHIREQQQQQQMAWSDRPLLPKPNSIIDTSSSNSHMTSPFKKKVKNGKPPSRPPSALSVIDDDEMCPTCLEAYSLDNPKVTTRCGHHYHLPCIYEWLERSTACPMCGKKMEYDEVG